jgi:hypothetical protein
LLNNAKFKAYLDAELAKSSQKLAMSREEWLKGVAEIARFNLADYFEQKGDDLDVSEDIFNKPDRHVIESIKVKTTTDEKGQVYRNIEFKAASKITAYQILGKALGFLDEKIEHSHSGQIDHNLKLTDQNIAHLNDLRKRFPLPNLAS